jgi:hypothetical protein
MCVSLVIQHVSTGFDLSTYKITCFCLNMCVRASMWTRTQANKDGTADVFV